MGMLEIYVLGAIIVAMLFPHGFGRWIGRIALGYRSVVNNEDTPDART